MKIATRVVAKFKKSFVVEKLQRPIFSLKWVEFWFGRSFFFSSSVIVTHHDYEINILLLRQETTERPSVFDHPCYTNSAK